VVLANGTVTDVSPTQHSDLWWALRGAGQSFAVVTSAVFNTFPQTNNGQHYNAEMLFRGDQLEDILTLTNNLIPVPPELGIEILFFVNPETAMVCCSVHLGILGTFAHLKHSPPSVSIYTCRHSGQFTQRTRLNTKL